MDLALHPLPSDLAEDEAALQQVRALLAAWTPHPRRLRVHGVERTAAGAVVVTAPEPPLSLRDILPRAGELAAEERAAWAAARAREIADALTGAPSPHRAIGPRSIGVEADGRAMLYPPLSWVRTAGAWTGRAAIRTAQLDWMSPEALRGEVVDARSDVYQLGLLVYRLLGAPWPYAGESDFSRVQAVLAPDEAPPLGAVGVRVPGELEAAVARAMSKSPDARFGSVAALSLALAPFARGSEGATRAVAEAAMRAPRAGRLPLFTELVLRPCAKRWDELAQTERPAVRSCAVCNLSVQRVTTLGALVPLEGSCVFYDPEPVE